jgi:hypothetical protein
MAQLAILGHTTRGKEVIEILEMLGGENKYKVDGKSTSCYFTIKEFDNTNGSYQLLNGYKIFTIEEFLEKYPYKVGDKVSSKYLKNYKIEKMEWEDTNNRIIYKLQGMGWYSSDELQPYKEETMTRKYNVEEYLKVWEETEKGLEVVVNDNFELKEYNGKFYIIKKQPSYPTTYEECCKVLNIGNKGVLYTEYNKNLLQAFQMLLICRDAYWMIGGEPNVETDRTAWLYYDLADNCIIKQTDNMKTRKLRVLCK